MSKCKTKAFKTDLGTFRHNQAYPGIIQEYSGTFGTLCNPGIEPWYIQNPDIFSTGSIFRTLAYSQPGIFRTPVYSERWHIQNLRHIQKAVKHLRGSVLPKWLTVIIIFINYNYFRSITLPRSPVHEINIMNLQV